MISNVKHPSPQFVCVHRREFEKFKQEVTEVSARAATTKRVESRKEEVPSKTKI